MLGRLSAVAAGFLLVAAPASAASHHPLTTGIVGGGEALEGASAQAGFAQTRAAGATAVRLTLDWRSVAPAILPAQFDPADPEDPSYRWEAIDTQVRLATSAGIEPTLNIVGVPSWANLSDPKAGGPGTPDPAALARFARAAAKRYSGQSSLPRVHDWQVWNEPNLDTQLSPQLVRGVPVSPRAYGNMVNAVAGAVKSVHSDNLVVAGGLAPFRDITPDTLRQNKAWGPLTFMRDLLCLSKTLKPTCANRVRFDVWATHPYTSGGPTHHAVLADDVSLGDLPEMRRVLDAGVRLHHVTSRAAPRFWVTEFSWDSNAPDPLGVPIALLRRWVPQALYQMWRVGIDRVMWFRLRDEPLTESFYQSGIYFHGGRAKPYLQGFRFPLVAFPRPHGVYVWGRTPAGVRGAVVVEQSFAGGWKRLGTVASDRFGVFERTFATGTTGTTGVVRARLVGRGETTLPFSLAAVPDHFYNPFGLTTLLEQKKP